MNDNVLWGVVGIAAFSLVGIGLLIVPAAISRRWPQLALLTLQAVVSIVWGVNAHAAWRHTGRWSTTQTVVAALWAATFAMMAYRLISERKSGNSRP